MSVPHHFFNTTVFGYAIFMHLNGPSVGLSIAKVLPHVVIFWLASLLNDCCWSFEDYSGETHETCRNAKSNLVLCQITSIITICWQIVLGYFVSAIERPLRYSKNQIGILGGFPSANKHTIWWPWICMKIWQKLHWRPPHGGGVAYGATVSTIETFVVLT